MKLYDKSKISRTNLKQGAHIHHTPGLASTSALLEATNAWSLNIDNGLLNGVVFIDLTKAFDTTGTAQQVFEWGG